MSRKAFCAVRVSHKARKGVTLTSDFSQVNSEPYLKRNRFNDLSY